MTVMVRSCFLQWCFESYHPLFSAHLFRRWLLSVVCGGVVSDLSLRQIFHGSLTLSLPRLRRRSCLCGGCDVGCVLASWFLIHVQSLMVADPAVLLESESGIVLVVVQRRCFSQLCVNSTEQRRRRRWRSCRR
jgi:hypothetical protein